MNLYQQLAMSVVLTLLRKLRDDGKLRLIMRKTCVEIVTIIKLAYADDPYIRGL